MTARDVWVWFTNNRRLFRLSLDTHIFELSLDVHWGRDNGEWKLAVSALDFGGFGDGGLIPLLSMSLWLVCVNLCLEV